jgi:predicted CoA-binding protein
MTVSPSNAFLHQILRDTKTIACIGVSMNPVRPSHFVARYLHYRGYRVIPVNPGQAGKLLFGEVIRADLSELADTPIDMIDIFRRPDAVPAILDQALEHLTPHLKTVWMQIGVQQEEAAAKAREHGLNVIQNRCPKIEYQRLFGELRKAGFNTGIISSRL